MNKSIEEAIEHMVVIIKENTTEDSLNIFDSGRSVVTRNVARKILEKIGVDGLSGCLLCCS